MSEKNTEVNNEALSSLMDGEWGDLDPSRSLADVAASKEQRDTWARYHLARDAMRGEALEGSFSIASAVSAAIADEPAYTNVTTIGGRTDESAVTDTNGVEPVYVNAPVKSAKPAQSRSTASSWGLGAAGFGIAASAALATFIGLQFWGDTQPTVTEGGLVAGIAAPISTPTATPSVQLGSGFVDRQAPVDLVSNRGSFWVGQGGQRADAEFRLNTLLSDHIEHSPTSDWNGMLPYSRLVGYDESKPVK